MYGALDNAMIKAIQEHVFGREVWNLGYGGSSAEPDLLLKLGAARVFAVDKVKRGPEAGISVRKGAHYCDMYYDEFIVMMDGPSLKADGNRVALLKWPDNGPLTGLTWLLDQCATVIYCGHNVFPTACGNSALWRYLAHRDVLSIIEGEGNDLIIYGNIRKERVTAPRCREERAAWEAWELGK